MVNSVNQHTLQMGDLYQDSGDKTRLFRKYNGVSSDQLLKPIKRSQEIAEKKVTDQLERISKENASILEADQYIRKLMTAVKALSNPSLTEVSVKSDAFGARTAFLSSSDPMIRATDTVVFSPGIGAPQGSMSIKVDRIATKDKLTANAVHTSKNTNITANETRIYVKGQAIKIPANATLEEISRAINTQKTETNVYAYVRKFSDTDYRLFLTGTEDGEKITLQNVVSKLSEPLESQVDPLNLAGTLVIGAEEKVITPSMNLSDIAGLINTIPDYAATISGAGPYTLDVTHLGSPTTLTSVATEKLFTQLGLEESAIAVDDLKASFYLDGSMTPILSSTNHIEGLYPKTTINLLAPTQGATVTADIEQDKGDILTAIDDFIVAYNELIEFANVQTARDTENGYQPKEDAYLANNSEFISVIDRLKQMYTKITGGVSGVNHMSTIGIRKDDEGFLVKNEEKLQEALDNNLDGVEQIFAFLAQDTTGGYFQVVAHPDKLPAEMMGKEVKVKVIKNSAGQYSAQMYVLDGVTVTHSVTIPYGSTAITVGGEDLITIKGTEDTIYEGFTFAYVGPSIETPVDPDTTVEEQGFKFSQGIGDILTKQLENIVLVPTDSDLLEDQETDLNKILVQASKRKKLEEKRLQDLKAKHLKLMQREERKAERFQRQMEKMQNILGNLQSLMAGFFAG